MLSNYLTTKRTRKHSQQEKKSKKKLQNWFIIFKCMLSLQKLFSPKNNNPKKVTEQLNTKNYSERQKSVITQKKLEKRKLQRKIAKI